MLCLTCYYYSNYCSYCTTVATTIALTGAIIGIIIPCVVALVAATNLGAFLCRRGKAVAASLSPKIRHK